MPLNSISDMTFGASPNNLDWTNTTRFPTYEGSEDKVRDDLNAMHFRLRDYINDNVVPTVNDLIAAVAQLVVGTVPDGSITNAKLSSVSDEDGAAVALENMQENSVGTSQLVDGSVTHAKLGENAVTRENISDGAVGPNKLSQGAVLETNMAQGSVNTNALIDLCVTAAKLAAGAVTETNMAQNSVNTNALINGCVTEHKLGLQAVTTDKLHAFCVSTLKIQPGAVNSTCLAADAKAAHYEKTVSSWGNTTQRVNVSDLTTDDKGYVIVTPASLSFNEWQTCGVRLAGVGDGFITLAYNTKPTGSLTFNILRVR